MKIDSWKTKMTKQSNQGLFNNKWIFYYILLDVQELQFGVWFLTYSTVHFGIISSWVRIEKSSTGSFRDQLSPLNYIQLHSELDHCCLGLSRTVTIRRWREAEREIDFICHWSTLQQYASMTFKMALKYSKLREFPCSWVGVDRLSGSIRKRQRKADVYIVSSNNNILPLCGISP